ncbi:MAG: DUF2156 domain-containing protein [Erysipelotrichales bacterium]|nr:DUF2156 domain-containing protein [Erysipelotrichales bacterium]
MEFRGYKRLAIDDRYKLIEYYGIANIEECNHNIINNYMWQSSFPLWWKEEDNVLYLIGMHNDELFMYMPLCVKEKREAAIKHLLDEFKDESYSLIYYTEEYKDIVLSLIPSLSVSEMEDSFDYIYEYDKITTLSGKKLQKKRNHVNAFKKEYEGRYQYCTIDDCQLDACLKVLDKWEHTKEALQDDEYLHNEYLGIKFLLQNYHELPIKGGCVYIDGVIEAFALGSYGSNRMVQENVEKADGNIRGLYPFLMSEFLKHEFKNEAIVYVNREDDLGLEYLRKSKRSLYPAFLVKKYLIRKE